MRMHSRIAHFTRKIKVNTDPGSYKVKLTKQQIELQRSGPISNEMFRLAAIKLRKEYGELKWLRLSEVAQRKHCIALLWNSADIFYLRAKHNLGT